MFASLGEVDQGLRAAGYIADSIATTTVYLAARLHKPLLLEGPAGSGNTLRSNFLLILAIPPRALRYAPGHPIRSIPSTASS